MCARDNVSRESLARRTAATTKRGQLLLLGLHTDRVPRARAYSAMQIAPTPPTLPAISCAPLTWNVQRSDRIAFTQHRFFTRRFCIWCTLLLVPLTRGAPLFDDDLCRVCGWCLYVCVFFFHSVQWSQFRDIVRNKARKKRNVKRQKVT